MTDDPSRLAVMCASLAPRLAKGILASLAAAAVLATAGLWMADDGGAAQASHGVISMGVDADPTGSTGTSLGAFDTCRGVTAGNAFDIDIYGTEVADLLSWEAYLSFDKSVLRVDNHSLLFQNAHSTSVSDTSEGTPDTSGLYRVGGLDMNATAPGSGASGDGVLARITLFAVADGFSPLSIEPIDLNDDGSLNSASDIGPWLKNASGALIGDADENGFFDGPIESAVVVVGGTDTDGDTLPDACDPDDDNDTLVDTNDNCPLIANPGQSDIDLDGTGDPCDGDADGDGYKKVIEDYLGSMDLNPNRLPEVCDGVDNDGDTQVDEGWDSNSAGGPDCSEAGLDSDGDGTDNPSDTDDDDDGSPDVVENAVVTSPFSRCAATSTPHNEVLDAVPMDLNDDQRVGLGDVLQYVPVFNIALGNPAYDRRFDMNADGAIGLADVLSAVPVFNTSCTP